MANFVQEQVLSDRYSLALQKAFEWHCKSGKGFQVRKQGTPYIAHLMSVSSLILEHGGSEDEAIAGLLHDAVEDVGVELSEIAGLFGDGVAQLVSLVTEDDSVPTSDRKQAYLERLRVSGDCGAQLVAVADKLHNLRCYSQQPHLQTDAVRDFYRSVIDQMDDWHRWGNRAIEPMRAEILELHEKLWADVPAYWG